MIETINTIDSNILSDIKNAFVQFVNGLNWAYIIMFTFVTYGIQNEPEFDWYNDLLKKSKLKTWIAGIIILLLFCLFTYLEEPKSLSAWYVSSISRSFMITIILHRSADRFLKTHIERKAKELNDDKEL